MYVIVINKERKKSEQWRGERTEKKQKKEKQDHNKEENLKKKKMPACTDAYLSYMNEMAQAGEDFFYVFFFSSCKGKGGGD